MPDFPCRRDASKSDTLAPLGATTPSPVTTTLCNRHPHAAYNCGSNQMLFVVEHFYFAANLMCSPQNKLAANRDTLRRNHRTIYLPRKVGQNGAHPAQFLRLRSSAEQVECLQYYAALCHRLEQNHPRSHRIAAKVPSIEVLVAAERRRRMDVPFIYLNDAIHETERCSLWKQCHKLLLVKRRCLA